MQIDFTNYFPSTQREFETREHNGEEARVLTIRRTYPTTTENLWDALTNIDRIPNWFLPISGDLKVGGKYQFEGNAGGEILECTPEEEFKVTWEYGDQMSWVNVSISPAPDGVNFQLEHIATVPQDMMDQYGPGATGVGWDSGLLGLFHHLNTGESTNPEKGMAWMMSDEGKAFIKMSSDAWGEASIASGTPPELALKAAETTRKAYTGETEE